jgi:ribosomal protein S7
MLLKEYKKYGKYGKYNFVLALKKAEFNFFLNKFFGSLISRGKKNLAVNMFNRILINFKNKFKSDPFVELHKAVNNLIPILSSTQKKMGKIYHAVPSLAVGTRRFVIMIS